MHKKYHALNVMSLLMYIYALVMSDSIKLKRNDVTYQLTDEETPSWR